MDVLQLSRAAVVGACMFALAGIAGAQPLADLPWQVVVNNGFEIPDNPGRYYNSYNPPSVNEGGLVGFRARSTGKQGGPVSGIYTRDMALQGAINKVADRNTEVPQPNNTLYPVPGGGGPPAKTLSTSNEFPSFPRIALSTNAVATRGNHPPVWTYVIGTDPNTGEDIETRVGTTGVYVNLDVKDPSSPLVTGASLLGEVPDFSSLFAVPGLNATTRFFVFPGAPAITDDGVIAFKGNYAIDDPNSEDPADVIGQTGVFYRKVVSSDVGGNAPIQRIANSETVIPNPGKCAPGTTFGSTAPPSAAGDKVVFVGFDDEENPHCGGIYRATLSQPSEISTLVGLETRVIGQGKATFTQFGEGLSYDGQLIGFWGAWGKQTKTVRLYCPQEGNKIRRLFCNNAPDPETGEIPGGGDPNSVCDDTTDPHYSTDPQQRLCYQEKNVPVNQGIFVYDTTASSAALSLRLVARTGPGIQFDDFLFWNYSGAPPGVGNSEGDAEPPRFRSSAFLAVSAAQAATEIRVAFKARTGDIDMATHTYVNSVDGIYLARGPGQAPILTLIETGMDGTILDPDAVWDDDADVTTPDVPLPVTSLAMERDAFRGVHLAIMASMATEGADTSHGSDATEEEGTWAGIYIVDVPDIIVTF